MNRQEVTKNVQELKETIDEIYDELNADSPRQIYILERIKHLRPQIRKIENLVGIGR